MLSTISIGSAGWYGYYRAVNWIWLQIWARSLDFLLLLLLLPPPPLSVLRIDMWIKARGVYCLLHWCVAAQKENVMQGICICPRWTDENGYTKWKVFVFSLIQSSCTDKSNFRCCCSSGYSSFGFFRWFFFRCCCFDLFAHSDNRLTFSSDVWFSVWMWFFAAVKLHAVQLSRMSR